MGWSASSKGAAILSEGNNYENKVQSVSWFFPFLISPVLDWSTRLLRIKAPVRQSRPFYDLLWILQRVVGLNVVGKTNSSQDIVEWYMHEECSLHSTTGHLTAVVSSLQTLWKQTACQNLIGTRDMFVSWDVNSWQHLQHNTELLHQFYDWVLVALSGYIFWGPQ